MSDIKRQANSKLERARPCVRATRVTRFVFQTVPEAHSDVARVWLYTHLALHDHRRRHVLHPSRTPAAIYRRPPPSYYQRLNRAHLSVGTRTPGGKVASTLTVTFSMPRTIKHVPYDARYSLEPPMLLGNLFIWAQVPLAIFYWWPGIGVSAYFKGLPGRITVAYDYETHCFDIKFYDSHFKNKIRSKLTKSQERKWAALTLTSNKSARLAYVTRSPKSSGGEIYHQPIGCSRNDMSARSLA